MVKPQPDPLTGDAAEIKVWDAENGKELLSLQVPKWDRTKSDRNAPTVTSIAFSPDGKRIVGRAKFDVAHNEVRVWDAAIGREVVRFNVQRAQGKREYRSVHPRWYTHIISSGGDGMVKV